MKKLESTKMMQTGGSMWFDAACSALGAIALHHAQIPTRITAGEAYIATCLIL
jgi:hypothetical protein